MPKPEPQDHKPKTNGEDVPDRFTFTHDGEDYTFAKTGDVLTPAFLRRNRTRDEADVHYLLIEQLSDEEQLDVIDSMGWKDARKFNDAFDEYINAWLDGINPGKSRNSSRS